MLTEYLRGGLTTSGFRSFVWRPMQKTAQNGSCFVCKRHFDRTQSRTQNKIYSMRHVVIEQFITYIRIPLSAPGITRLRRNSSGAFLISLRRICANQKITSLRENGGKYYSYLPLRFDVLFSPCSTLFQSCPFRSIIFYWSHWYD